MRKKIIFPLLVGLICFGGMWLLGQASDIKNVSTRSKRAIQSVSQEYERIDENYIGADFSGGEIAYRLDSAISENINTFEAWIRMEKNECRSVIFGNYNYWYSKDKYIRCVNWEITKDGYVSVWWAGTRITFTSIDVRTSEWIHVSVVRDTAQQKFLLYINGQYQETASGYANADTTGNSYRQRIGGDCRHPGEDVRKYPFYGEIGQITCYSSVRTADQIKKDYEEHYKISHLTRDNSLLFNTMLMVGDTVAQDTSINCNNAKMLTNDLFYEGDLYPTGDYTFAVIGDTQKLVRANSAALDRYMDWLLDNQEGRKIQAMMHMGDLTDGNTATSEEEWAQFWNTISTPIRRLNGKLPYILTPGNHDYRKDYRDDLNAFNQYFPYDEQAQMSYFGGAYQEGQRQNMYYLLNCVDIPYVVITLEQGPSREVMEWACQVMEQYSDRRVILMTHVFLDSNGELFDDSKSLSANWCIAGEDYTHTEAADMWEKYLYKHDNLFMILCGHSASESIAYKELLGENGNTVMAFKVDPSYIVGGYGLDTIMGLFSMHEDSNTLYFNLFSIDKNELYNIQNQMEINYGGFTKYTRSYYQNK